MASQKITTEKNTAGQWEVRRGDDGSLLGVFTSATCRDLFIEALRSLAGQSHYTADSDTVPVQAYQHDGYLAVA